MGAEDWNSRPHTYLASDLTQRASPSLRTLLHNPINFCKNFAIGRFFFGMADFSCVYSPQIRSQRESSYHQSLIWWINEFYYCYLEECGWRVTGVEMIHSQQLSSRPIPAWMAVHKSLKSGAHCPACRQLTGWRAFFACCSVGLYLFPGS